MRPAKFDLTNVTFGSLTALKKADPPEGMPKTLTYWLCRCEKCLGTEVISHSDLAGNRRRRCSICTEKERNIVGQVMGTWEITEKAGEEEIPNLKTAGAMSWWKVKCVLCGKTAIRDRPSLRKLLKQCECIQRPVVHQRPFVQNVKPDNKMTAKVKTCTWCGKEFELECIGQWGWNIGADLFCTYKCMRLEEKNRKNKKRKGEKLA